MPRMVRKLPTRIDEMISETFAAIENIYEQNEKVGELAKPRFGSPCNGCGLCCRSEVCGVGLAAFGQSQPAPCPALVVNDGRYWCGLVLMEQDSGASPLFAQTLAIGRGCDSDDEESE